MARNSGITVTRHYEPDPAREAAAILALLGVGRSGVAPNGSVSSGQEEAATPVPSEVAAEGGRPR
jgi:hypothetical protein